MRPARAAAVLIVLLAGCAPAPDAVGWILLDEDARAAGLEITQGTWRGSPILPTELGAGTWVEVSGPTGSVPVRIEGGQGTWVRGTGIVEHVQAEPDALIVDASAGALAALAALTEGSITPRDDGLATLRATMLFAKLSFAEEPPALRGVAPIEAQRVGEAESGPARVPIAVAARPVGAALQLIEGSEKIAAIVGLHEQDDRSVFVDAEGGFVMYDCADEIARGTVEERGGGLVLVGPEGPIDAAWATRLTK